MRPRWRAAQARAADRADRWLMPAADACDRLTRWLLGRLEAFTGWLERIAYPEDRP